MPNRFNDRWKRFKLIWTAVIPVAGAPGGPPLIADRRMMWGMSLDMRTWTINVERHPEQLPAELKAMMESFQREAQREQALKK
jgi:hypothetical protein